MAFLQLWFSIIIPHMRPILVAGAVVNLCGVALWIGCIFVPIPNRFPMLWAAIFLGPIRYWIILTIDWFGHLGVVFTVRLSPIVSKKLGKSLKNTFAYYPGNRFWL
jgi:hypothetical protein